MYDAIVVGARCAGSSTAMLLARRGYKVLLVDRATFPSDTLSTHQLQISGGAQLRKWGLLEQVAATGCPPIRSLRFEMGSFLFRGSPPPLDGVDAMYSPRRYKLDTILLHAAEEAGAEVRTQFSVKELAWEGERVTGIRGRSSHGTEVTEQARIVVGADGLHSLVARSVGAPAYRERPSLSCAYYTYWEGVQITEGELYGRERRQIGVMPTNDGQVCIYLGLPHDEFSTFRTDVEGNFMKAMSLVPDLAERLRAGKRAERFYGTGELPNYFRKPYGPGWALVGDAGYHKDSITGQGMSDAFRDAELLADALDAVWGGRQSEGVALRGYEQTRNKAALPMYNLTCQIASFAPPSPVQQQVFAAVSRSQAQTDRFFGILTGSVPVNEFFSPGNILRLLGASGLARTAVLQLGQRFHRATQGTPEPSMQG